MKLADGIAKHGFRKWYERELLQSHAHLALCFLCMIGIFAAIEAIARFRDWTDQITDGLALVACIGVGLWSLRRYLQLLGHAEVIAHQAECKQCGTYGRLVLVKSEADGSVGVRCKKCEHEWRIEG